MQTTSSGNALLSPFDERYLRDGFRRLLPVDETTEAHLRGVIDDVLDHPGSLLRAQLVFAILRAHDVECRLARAAAVAVEYFHTASLVFDDLPSMDDARERRGRPCPHRIYGEAAATLAALALVNQGYALLWQVLDTLTPARRREAAALVSDCLGTRGILNGQALDLHFADRPASETRVLEVARGKTVTLIRLTLLLPAIVAGTSPAQRRQLDRLAMVWGLSYQILDDFKDGLMSGAETGKSPGRDAALGRPNLPAVLGTEPALARLVALLDEGRLLLRSFARDGRWPYLERIQGVLENERRKVERRLPVAACA